jgi:trimethylamine:corrinoid methyltransferase-like protein
VSSHGEGAAQRANREARKIVAQHQPNYIDANVDAKLREKFKIL